ncbi:MAG TPA: sulfurtransferase [Rhodothermales bacterium]|nr:sulfurtransferase [Rhodothermales bacterium]
MPFTTLLTPNDLLAHLEDPGWAVVDCRFSLDRPERGRADYLAGHIPGAVYADLAEDLSGQVIPGKTGRHPLPSIEAFVETLSRWGIADGVQVAVYDDAGGSVAARLWWMLRWLGHDAVAVLDGGWPAWQSAGFPTREGPETRPSRAFEARPRAESIASVEDVARANRSGYTLLDARAGARFRGEVEPIDPVAGHIPGALCVPFSENLDEEGRFRPPGELRARFEALLSGASPSQVIAYCGSGVTATHNLLALEHAGLSGARLYPGSWSEWITDPSRGVER